MKTLNDIKAETHLPALMADTLGVISWVNASFQQTFGWTRDEAVGQPLTLLIPRYLQDAHHLGMSRFLSTGKGRILNQPIRLRSVNKSGAEFDAEHVIVAEADGEGWTFGATIEPVDP